MKRTALFLMLAAAALPAVAAIAPPTGVAPALRASAEEEPAFMLSADGVHIYQCRQVDPNGRFGWVFTAPDATLFEGSRSAATHKTPNLFESLSDRSSVSGVVRATQGAGGNNLPWVAINAQPIGPSGMFADVTSIQRVNTQGGVAPAEGCGPANDGAESRIGFRADYYFYKRRGAA
jgi:hypothetical protein